LKKPNGVAIEVEVWEGRTKQKKWMMKSLGGYYAMKEQLWSLRGRELTIRVHAQATTNMVLTIKPNVKTFSS
jgi:hypothetical protein